MTGKLRIIYDWEVLLANAAIKRYTENEGFAVDEQ